MCHKLAAQDVQSDLIIWCFAGEISRETHKKVIEEILQLQLVDFFRKKKSEERNRSEVQKEANKRKERKKKSFFAAEKKLWTQKFC